MAIAVGILVVLYYAGVVHSKISVGIALTAMSLLLFVSAMLSPPHNEE